MGFQGIVECFHSTEKWFTGVGLRAQTEQAAQGVEIKLASMREGCARFAGEQEAAAAVGRYGTSIQLGYSSDSVNGSGQRQIDR
jgi:hypothetical protein